MPKATVTQETKRIDLRSCEGGFVELRTLSFHEMNIRQEMAARVYQEQKTLKKGEKRKPDAVIRGYFEIMNVAVTQYEFRNCIVDHNLEDENGIAIDFTEPMQKWRLDPKVGQEISEAIDELNQLDQEDEEEEDPLGMQRSSPSLVEAGTLKDSTDET